jgi:flavin reductase (DIM6/NTAB) family NADH-FMN oxidoreductase RutF
MTMAWYMMVDFVPPVVACIMSSTNHSFKNLSAAQECGINIPTVELIEKVVGVGKCTGSKVDKFKKFKFTPVAASAVDVPMIGECYANLECKVIDMSMATKYNMVFLEVVKAWVVQSRKRPRTFHHWGNGIFVVDGRVIKLPFKSY